MPGDPFYKTKHWQRLRAEALRRDLFTCVVPGCGGFAVVVDHVQSRRDGGSDTLDNLRSLCRKHDNGVKERAGARANGGRFVVSGCFPDGSPRDPAHPWYTGGRGVRSSEVEGLQTGGVPPNTLTSEA